ncbi:glycosyltransferase [Cellulomonas sp. Root137]|uniref:glycosyltransferase n=1 Tax=Cellulomonas sp. Root137 TaxID=1736459 RepID=UPI001F1A674D|nr:glycosyltransferase [Cellulomonas sp. Root137]
MIAHEWISRTGGSEKVLDAMVAAFPGAKVLTLWNDDAGRRYPGRDVQESWMARTPFRRHKALALPAMPMTWRDRDIASVDWILASSHLFAHHVSLAGAPDVPKYAYVYTPARYVWTPELDTRGAGLAARALAPALKHIDRKRAQEPDKIAAISNFVRERIESSWLRDADVIYPPVDVRNIQAGEPWADTLEGRDRQIFESLPADFVLGASRFVPYKRLEQAIEIGEAVGLPVVLAGDGPDRRRLEALAEDSATDVFFVGAPSDQLLYALFERAVVYVFLAIEDFGIMPVESLALGTPVIVPDAGGASETVVDGLHGAHIHELSSPEAKRDAFNRATSVSAEACRIRARDFDTERFDQEITTWVANA